MTHEAMLEQLQYRIESDVAHFGGTLPDRNALAWHAYLLGLFEWSAIDRSTYEQLVAILPAAKDPLFALPQAQRPPTEAESVIQELRTRIKDDIARSRGRLPERQAIYWHAYLAALLEWSVIYAGFHQLIDLLPELEDDPVRDILLGRPPPGGDTW
jgi:hypothetical protein